MNIADEIKRYKPINAEEKAEWEIIKAFLEGKGELALTRASQLAHFTSTAMIFNETKDKLLMVHHNIHHTWACVGGHADGMADLLQVALKEAEEETGLSRVTPITEEILSLDILHVAKHYKRGEYVPEHLHLNATYGLMASEGEMLQIKKDENSDVQWVPISKLEDYTQEEEFVRVYKKVIKKVIK